MLLLIAAGLFMFGMYSIKTLYNVINFFSFRTMRVLLLYLGTIFTPSTLERLFFRSPSSSNVILSSSKRASVLMNASALR